VNCILFRGDVFVHVGSAQLSTENCVSFYMCSAVELAWLAQNIRQSSHGRLKDLFQGGGALGDFSKILPGVAKNGEICFSPTQN